MLESGTDLGLPREEALIARWGTSRIKIERDLQLYKVDPALPIAFKQDLEFDAHVLDHMIARAPGRARLFGESAEVAAWMSVRMYQGVIEYIRSGEEQIALSGAEDLRLRGLL